MAKGTQRIPQELQRWIDARKRFHLSHARVQMARELGMNPRKLGPGSGGCIRRSLYADLSTPEERVTFQ